jgi:DNA recombination protein Rad52
MDDMSFFEDKTIQLLKEPLAVEDVKHRKGTGNQQLSYVASYHVINEANRIFGFGMWSTEIQYLHQVDKTIYVKPPYKAGEDPKEMISMSYLCQLKLTVANGEKTVSHADTGFGNGVAGNTAHGIGSVIELASKEAVTDALKRCLRYYGSKFGLSLYDKDDDTMLSNDEIENQKLVTPEQLSKLRELYEARGVDDEWVLTALKAEHYPLDSLELMRFDWYQLALNITHKYKLKEIEAASYQDDIKRVIDLMKKSGNFNMLKALYLEAHGKAKEHNDKKTLLEIVKIKDEIKAQLEAKEAA